MQRQPARAPLTVATRLAAALSGDPLRIPGSERATGLQPYHFAFPTCFYIDLDVEHVVYDSLALVFQFYIVFAPLLWQ